MRSLCRSQGIHHNRQVAAGGVLHPHRNIQTAGSQAVLLVLYRTCTNCNIGQQIRQIPVVFRIEHFVCTSQTCLLNGTGVQFANSDQSLQHIFLFLRIRLVHHALVAFTSGAGLIGVDPRDQKQLILYLFLYLCQTADIIQNSVFPIRRARSDDQQLLVGFTGKHLFDLRITLRLDIHQLFRQRELGFQFLRNRQLSDKFHIHVFVLLSHCIRSCRRIRHFAAACPFRTTMSFISILYLPENCKGGQHRK